MSQEQKNKLIRTAIKVAIILVLAFVIWRIYDAPDAGQKTEAVYTFRNNYLLDEHFKKHGGEFDYADASAYENGASAVVNDPDALHKTEKDDGDDIYYLERTNELVIVSKDGYIRTYFKPDSGIKYYNKQ